MKQRKDAERDDAPRAVAAREVKKRTEFDRGVRIGWWDQDSAPPPQTDDAVIDDDAAHDGDSPECEGGEGGADGRD